MEQEIIFCRFAFFLCWRSWCSKTLLATRNRRDKFVSLTILLHGNRCSQFSYTDFLQRCLERDPNEEDNTVEVPLTNIYCFDDEWCSDWDFEDRMNWVVSGDNYIAWPPGLIHVSGLTQKIHAMIVFTIVQNHSTNSDRFCLHFSCG